MVGGPGCVPLRVLSHKELTMLLYHRVFHFTRGKDAAQVLPRRVAITLAKNKWLGEVESRVEVLFLYGHCN